MRILTRDQFKQMPKGTVFCKVSLDIYGCAGSYTADIHTPMVLDDKPWDCGDGVIDFFYTELGNVSYPKSGIDYRDAFDNMRYQGEEIELEHAGQRDGLFEDDSVGYAVYSKGEIEEMVLMLQSALKNFPNTEDKGASVELSKRDIINMVRGTSPNYEGMSEAIAMELGTYTGGMVDRFDWNGADSKSWDKYTSEELLLLYRHCL